MFSRIVMISCGDRVMRLVVTTRCDGCWLFFFVSSLWVVRARHLSNMGKIKNSRPNFVVCCFHNSSYYIWIECSHTLVPPPHLPPTPTDAMFPTPTTMGG